MYSAAGNLVLAGRGNKINVSAIPPGVYVLVIYSGNEELGRLRFVKE